MYKTNLIGLCGYARSGKDTICKALHAERRAFADALKDDVNTIIQSRFNLGPDNPEDKELIRPIYVEWGRLGRKVDPDYWLKRIDLNLRGYDNLICITDVRYLNEVKFIQDLGGEIFFISRFGLNAANREELTSVSEILNCKDLKRPIISLRNDSIPEDVANNILLYLK